MKHDVQAILRGDPNAHVSAGTCVAGIVLGCGLYGAAIGSWRAPEMTLFVGIKLPVLILATLLVNGLMNGILGQLLGSGLSVAESLHYQLMSFLLVGLLLGSLCPVAFAMGWSLPGWTDALKFETYRLQVHIHTAVILRGNPGQLPLVPNSGREDWQPAAGATNSGQRGWRGISSPGRNFPGICGPFSAAPTRRLSSFGPTGGTKLFTNPSLPP